MSLAQQHTNARPDRRVIDWACKEDTTWIARNVRLATLDPRQVAEAVVASLCDNPRLRPHTGGCLVRFDKSDSYIKYLLQPPPPVGAQQQQQQQHEHIIFSLAQIEAFCKGPAKDAPPHLVVQYIVVIASLICISNDIVSPGNGQTNRCRDSALEVFLKPAVLEEKIDAHIVAANTGCLTVTLHPDGNQLTIELNKYGPWMVPNEPHQPILFGVTIQYDEFIKRGIPPLMISMILLNFMMSAAQERMNIYSPGNYKRSPESWGRLVGPPGAKT